MVKGEVLAKLRDFWSVYKRSKLGIVGLAIPVSYTHLTLPTN